jgi:phosphogluconate dehydratase
VLQDKGFRVALVTDGRMSGASGRVPAAIHLAPEGACGGPIARLRDGDMVRVDAHAGTIDVLVDNDEFARRAPAAPDLRAHGHGVGRELFAAHRAHAAGAEQGAVSWEAA